MASDLEKRQRARETVVEAGGKQYTVRRPTAMQRIHLAGASPVDLVRECVVGWNLQRIDLYPGGDPQPAAFDVDLWADWLADSPEIWEPLSRAIVDMVGAHEQRLEDAAKN